MNGTHNFVVLEQKSESWETVAVFRANYELLAQT